MVEKLLVRYISEVPSEVSAPGETPSKPNGLSSRAENAQGGIFSLPGAAELDGGVPGAVGATLTRTLDSLFVLLGDLIPYDRICLSTIDDDGRAVTLKWCRSHRPMFLQAGHRTEIDGTVLPPIMSHRIPAIIDDLEAYFYEHPDCETTRLLVAEEIRSSLICPLLVKGSPVGFLFFSSTDRAAYTEDLARLGLRIADIVAPVVERNQILNMLLQRDAWIRRNQEELERSRRDLDRFFDLSLDLLCVAGTDGYFKVVNPSFQKVLGYSLEALLAVPFLDFVHPEDRKDTIREVERLGQGMKTVEFENRYRCKDGSYRWLQWNTVSVPEDGLLYAVARDVTDSKDRNRKMRIIVEGAPTAMVLTDQEDRIVLANKRMEALFKYGPGELTGLPASILVPKDQREDYEKVRAQLWEERRLRDLGSSGLLSGQCKDGTLVTIEISSSPVDLEQTYLLSTVKDVTDQKRSMERVRTIVESSPDGILLMGENGTIAMANSSTERIFGYPRQELLGNPLEILLPQRYREAHTSHRTHFISAGSERSMGKAPYSLYGLHKSGREVPLDIALKPIEMHGERYVIATVRDLTERKRMEREFTVAREVQRALMPENVPQIPGFEIAIDLRPAEATGGDFINFSLLPGRGLVLAVGDVSGHGLGPAILTASVMSYLRAFTREEDHLQDILRKTNALLFEETREEDFATAFLARIDPQKRILRYASAGHPEGYVFDRSGNLRRRLSGTGFPLGMFAEVEPWKVETVSLDAGDTVVVITDGIYEATSPEGEMFGDEKLLEAMRDGLEGGPGALLESIYGAVAAFTESQSREDDMTVLAVRVVKE